MVKHIIMWNLKEEFNNDDIKKEIKNGIESLAGKIPGLIEIKVETNRLATSSADIMLYSVFENEDALKGYTVHPEHVTVANNNVRPYTQGRACFDFIEE